MSTPTETADPEVVYVAGLKKNGTFHCTADDECERDDAVGVARFGQSWFGAAVCPDHDTPEWCRKAVEP